MRSQVGICILVASGIASIGCDGSKSSGRYDASAAVQGGSVGNGGMLGSGGVAATGGTGSLVAGGTSGTVASGAGGSGSGGIASGTGGRNSGGSATGGATMVGSGGIASGSGGARTGGSGSGGVLGGGGSGAGGIASGGASGPATGGAGGTIPPDASTDAAGDAPGIDGAGTAVYSACSYLGDIVRANVAKFDPQLGTCAIIELSQPSSRDAGVGLTVSGLGWGVEGIYLWRSTTNDCLRAGRVGVSATSASGTVSVMLASLTVDVDAVLNFPSSDAGPAMTVEMKANGVTANHSCSS